MKKVDFHMHTNYSDGDFDIKDVVKLASEAGLEVIAITDHDRCDHYNIVKEEADKYGIRAIKGIEISGYDYDVSKKVHIVGLFLADETSNIKRLNDITNKKREAYHISLFDKLKEDGFDLDYEFVKKFAPNSIIYKSNIFWALKDKYPNRMQGIGFKDIFHERTDNNLAKKMGYIDVKDAIEAINKDGGLSILAHPQEYDNWSEIERYVSFGLRAIEINHSRMKARDFIRAEAYADKYKLLKSGGSDFHRLGKFNLGDYGLELEQYLRLISNLD